MAPVILHNNSKSFRNNLEICGDHANTSASRKYNKQGNTVSFKSNSKDMNNIAKKAIASIIKYHNR